MAVEGYPTTFRLHRMRAAAEGMRSLRVSVRSSRFDENENVAATAEQPDLAQGATVGGNAHGWRRIGVHAPFALRIRFGRS
jgi:hypothetical protein